MKKLRMVLAVLLGVLLAGGALLFVNVTAAAAPQLEAEPPDALPGQLLQAMLTGEEMAVTQAQLNGLLALLPEEEGLRLLGVELTGENAAVVWAEAAASGYIFSGSFPLFTFTRSIAPCLNQLNI